MALIGDDTDLLVLLLHLINKSDSTGTVWMHRPNAKDTLNITKLVASLGPEKLRYILAVFALSGCDIVTSTYKIGKTKLFKLLFKHPDVIGPLLKVFYKKEVDEETLFTQENKYFLHYTTRLAATARPWKCFDLSKLAFNISN